MIGFTFALILSVENATGGYSDFVIDHNLTADDCMVIKRQWETTLDENSFIFCFAEVGSLDYLADKGQR